MHQGTPSGISSVIYTSKNQTHKRREVVNKLHVIVPLRIPCYSWMECYDVLNSYILAPWFYYSSNSLAKCVHVLCSQICFMLQVLNNGIEQQIRLFANNQMYLGVCTWRPIITAWIGFLIDRRSHKSFYVRDNQFYNRQRLDVC